jgi:hypothetical protein
MSMQDACLDGVSVVAERKEALIFPMYVVSVYGLTLLLSSGLSYFEYELPDFIFSDAAAYLTIHFLNSSSDGPSNFSWCSVTSLASNGRRSDDMRPLRHPFFFAKTALAVPPQ